MCPFDGLRDWFNPKKWDGMEYMPTVCFGGLVGLMRLVSSAVTNWKDKSRQWTLTEWRGSRLVGIHIGAGVGGGAGGGVVVAGGLPPELPGGPGMVMMTFGPALVMVAIGAGSAIEVGLIGGYGQEDMREWRASMVAYLMTIGTFWAVLCVLSIYGPPFLWWAGRRVAWAAGAGLVVTSVFGRTGGPERKDRRGQDQKEPA